MKLITFILLFASVLGGGADYYVAPYGSDSDPGTRKMPFATLGRAQRAVRERVAMGTGKAVTVEIRGGVYEIAEPLRFGPEDCTGGILPVTYRAAKGQEVIISGGRVLKGWQPADRGVWKMEIPEAKDGKWKFRQLFVNGERRVRARYPNSDYLRVAQVGADKRTNFTFNEGDLPKFSQKSGMELVFLHDWSISRVPVKSVDYSARILTAAVNVGPSANHYRMDHFEKQPRYFLENSMEFLDAPGEWYLDPEKGELFYMPLEDEKPGELEVVAPYAEELAVIEGDKEAKRPVSRLRFQGLRFENCAWAYPGRYAAGQAVFHEEMEANGGIRVSLPAAIKAVYAEDCVFADCTVAHTGGSGIWIGADCNRNTIAGAHVYDTGGNGIMVGDTGGEVPASSNIVEDCLVEHCGRQFFGAVGIWVGMTQGTQVRYNEVRFQPYTGVSVGWRWNPQPSICRENIIEGNHIHHIMQVLSDGGGIYTLGRQPGTELRNNLIHDVSVNIGRAESNGMFLDQGTSEMVISHNVIYNIAKSPLRFHQAVTNIVKRNVLVTGRGVPHIRYNNTKEEYIKQRDNTVVSNYPLEAINRSNYGPGAPRDR